MGVLIPPALAVAAALLVGLVGTGSRPARLLALVLLVLQLAGALASRPDAPVPLGGATLQLTPFAHLAVVLIAGGSLATTILGMIIGLPPRWTAVAPLQVGLLAAAATTGEIRTALLFAWAAASVALVAAPPPPSPDGEEAEPSRPAVFALQVTVPAAIALLVAAAFPAGAATEERDRLLLVLGAAGVAAAAAAVPFHRWATAGGWAPTPLVVPALLLWPPAILAASALTWASLGLGLPPAPMERGLVAIVGLGGYLAASLAALAHDDLRRVIVYLTLQDGGIVLLAVAAGPHGWEAARSWILVAVAAKGALALWAALLVAPGTSERHQLRGWARRLPLAAGGVVAAAAASVGLPGLVSWWARERLSDLVFPGGGWIAAAAGLVAFLPYLRWLLVGAAPVSPALALADGFARPPWRWIPSLASLRPVGPRIKALEPRLRASWPHVRFSAASLLVLAAALVALATAGDLVGVRAAAVGPPPAGSVASPAPPSSLPGPSFVPLPSP